MKKITRIGLLFVLCGLALLTLPGGVGSAQARSVKLAPIQVQSTGYTDSKGTITVSAVCPQNYHVQSGNAQVTAYNQGQTPMYGIQFNGPDTRGSTWTTTVENKMAGSLNVTVTASCEETSGK